MRLGHAYAPSTVAEPKPVGTLAYESAATLSVEDFIAKYERPNLPVVISGLADEWRASREWTFEKLYRRHRHGKFKVGEDDDGFPVKVKFKYFARYLAHQRDDSPLYIFDSSFDRDPRSREILSDYEVPKYFRDDLFKLVGDKRRPPFRWFLVGPQRSGTRVHIDPLATSAWNTLLVGRKRFVSSVSSSFLSGPLAFSSSISLSRLRWPHRALRTASCPFRVRSCPLVSLACACACAGGCCFRPTGRRR